MKEGDIIAFRATGERRHVQPGEWYLCGDGACLVWHCGEDELWLDATILAPIPPAEIAQAERTLAAVRKWEYVLAYLAEGNFTTAAQNAAKEILGSC